MRLNIQSNWGGVRMSYGLSEVQFSAMPVRARTPEPASGSVDLALDPVVTWRAGHDVDYHVIYVSTGVNAVADGTAPSVTSGTNSLDMTSLNLELGQTDYWRVDEVNEAEVVSVWAGPVWNFSTVDALVVEDFEGYSNFSPDRPFQTWLDGIGYSADEFFPVAYEGNGTGAAIGHDIWSPASPHFEGTIMETSITAPGSSQAMPFYYSNTGGAASQTERIFAEPQDWTIGVKGADAAGMLYIDDIRLSPAAASVPTSGPSIYHRADNVDGAGTPGDGSTTTLVNLASPGTHDGTIIDGVVQNATQAGTTNQTRHYLRLGGIDTDTRTVSYDEYPPSGNAVTADSPLFDTGTFSQLVVTRSGDDTMTFYKDGVQVGSTKNHSETLSGSVAQTWFGGRNTQNESFDGEFCIIRVYETVLTGAEVLENYTTEIGK